MIVSLSGVDCSGKSTQLALLERHLRGCGRDVQTIWYRPGYSPWLDGARALVRRVRPGSLPQVAASDSPPDARREAFAKPSVRRAWLAMASVDTLVQYAVSLRLQAARHDVILCDRYVDDGALDLRLRFPDLRGASDAAFRLIGRVAPRPAPALLLMVPHAVMVERMKLKQEPFPDPPRVRDARYAAYEALAASGRYVTIDGSQPPEQVHAEILASIART